jgi:hypothetical protein
MDYDPLSVTLLAGMAVCVAILGWLAWGFFRVPKSTNADIPGELRSVWKDLRDMLGYYRRARATGLGSPQALEGAKAAMSAATTEEMARRTGVPVAVILAFKNAHPYHSIEPSVIEGDASGALYLVYGACGYDEFGRGVPTEQVTVTYRGDGRVVDSPVGRQELTNLSPEELPPAIRNATELAVAGGRIMFAHGPDVGDDPPTYEVVIQRNSREFSVEIEPGGRVIRIEELH